MPHARHRGAGKRYRMARQGGAVSGPPARDRGSAAVRLMALLSGGKMSSMEPLAFPGTYVGPQHSEDIAWHATSRKPYDTQPPQIELRTVIAGVEFRGGDLDMMDPDDPVPAAAAGFELDPGGSLTNCVLSGELPCSVDEQGKVTPATISFALDLRPEALADRARPKNLRLGATLSGESYAVTSEWFEDGLLALQATLPPDTRLHCCITCQFSDYPRSGTASAGCSATETPKASTLPSAPSVTTSRCR
jgi:hypothetical protein